MCVSVRTVTVCVRCWFTVHYSYIVRVEASAVCTSNWVESDVCCSESTVKSYHIPIRSRKKKNVRCACVRSKPFDVWLVDFGMECVQWYSALAGGSYIANTNGQILTIQLVI